MARWSAQRQKVKGWMAMARIPFHSVGVMPFLLGAVMAWHDQRVFNGGLLAWGTLGVILIMLTTYFFGECFDFAEDTLSHQRGASRFAGGSGMVPAGVFARRAPFLAGIACLIMAGVVGCVIQFGYETGPWTIPLGIVGIVGGALYSAPPVRWVSTGLGELWIGICYGWLPVAVSYYLPTGRIDFLVAVVPLPVAATIFNVILENEYPDYESDKAAGKRNMLVRLGRVRGAWLYAAASAVGWAGVGLSLAAGVSTVLLAYYLLPFVLSVYTTIGLLRGDWKDRDRLERICAMGIVVNLGTTLAFILTFL